MPSIPPIVIGSNPNADISDRVSSMEVSLTADEASQLSLTVHDPGLEMLRANYFQMRQPVTYLGLNFEVAAMEVQQGNGQQQVSLSLRSRAIQTLKRQKNNQVGAGGGLTFVANKAREVGLALFMEYSSPVSNSNAAASGSSKTDKANTSQSSSGDANESAWDVIKRIAGDYKYIAFETDNRLFFCSEPFLLGKFGIAGYGENPGFISIPVIWNAEPRATRIVQSALPIIGPPERPTLRLGSTGRAVEYLQQVLSRRAGQNITDPLGTYGFSTQTALHQLQRFMGVGMTNEVGMLAWNLIDFLGSGLTVVGPDVSWYYITPLGVPTLRKSDDAYEAATFDFQVEREQGKLLRPGMTVRIDGVPFFEGHYLITQVGWNEGTIDPVQVSGRTLVEPKPTTDGKNDDLNRFRAALSWTGGGYANDVIGVPAWSVSS